MTNNKTGTSKCLRTDGGRMQTLYTDDIIIGALKEIDQHTTPAKVAEKVDCNIITARNKLKSLYNRGIIQGSKLTGRWVFWI